MSTEAARKFPLNPPADSIMYIFALYDITRSMGLLALVQTAAWIFFWIYSSMT